MLTTQAEVRAKFWDYIEAFYPELKTEYRRYKRQNEYCTDIRCMFVDYVDSLMKDGIISEKLADKVTL